PHSATTSLLIRGGWRGADQALNSPKSTPAPSIAPTVASIGGGSSGTCPVHRRSDSNMSWPMKRSVGCCIQTSTITTGELARAVLVPSQHAVSIALLGGGDGPLGSRGSRRYRASVRIGHRFRGVRARAPQSA